MRHCCNDFQRTIFPRTLTEANIYIRHHVRSFAHTTLVTWFYHKFWHGHVSYRFDGENINVMLRSSWNCLYQLSSFLVSPRLRFVSHGLIPHCRLWSHLVINKNKSPMKLPSVVHLSRGILNIQMKTLPNIKHVWFATKMIWHWKHWQTW